MEPESVHCLYMQGQMGQQHDVVIAVPDVVEHLEIELDDVCRQIVDDTHY